MILVHLLNFDEIPIIFHFFLVANFCDDCVFVDIFCFVDGLEGQMFRCFEVDDVKQMVG